MNRPGRNDPCWCGSGVKYKKCHLRADQAQGAEAKEQSAYRQTVWPGKVSPGLGVPSHIVKPDYAAGGRLSSPARSCRKNSEEIERMRRVCQAAREVLDLVVDAVVPGVTTQELDRLAHQRIVELGAYPSPLNYLGFPKSICTSVNEVIVHGIPDDRPLAEGDTVNCDVTLYLDGMHGDCSETVLVGRVAEEDHRLVQVTWECLQKAIEIVRPGQPINHIGLVIEGHARRNGYSVVREFTGHGIGSQFHMLPYIAHFYEAENSLCMEEGMTFTIEPMINQGEIDSFLWADGWTAVTRDYSRSAQFEHTILVTADGVEVLTGGRYPRFLGGR